MGMIDLFGYFAGIFVVVSLVPQVMKSWRTKQTRDISLWRYILYTTGLILWIVYGALTSNGPVMVMNSVAFTLSMSMLYLKVKYSKN